MLVQNRQKLKKEECKKAIELKIGRVWQTTQRKRHMLILIQNGNQQILGAKMFREIVKPQKLPAGSLRLNVKGMQAVWLRN